MAEANGRAMTGIAWALSTSKNYPAHALLDALVKPGMPKQALLDVIAAQKARYTVRELLERRLHARAQREKRAVQNHRRGRRRILGG